MEREVVRSNAAPSPVGSYSQAVRAGGFLFVSGQLGFRADGELADSTVAQLRHAMQNLRVVLEAGGGSLEALVKISVYLADLGDYEVVNGIFTDFFGEAPPARELVEVARIPRDAAVEISAVGVVGS